MQTRSYWKQFENTGRIEDYLSYREKECGAVFCRDEADRTSAGAGFSEESADGSCTEMECGEEKHRQQGTETGDGQSCRNSYK